MMTFRIRSSVVTTIARNTINLPNPLRGASRRAISREVVHVQNETVAARACSGWPGTVTRALVFGCSRSEGLTLCIELAEIAADTDSANLARALARGRGRRPPPG